MNTNSQKTNLTGLYSIESSPEIDSFLLLADQLNARLQESKARHPEMWPTILGKLRVDWTYNSNTIEGSTLSRGETHFFLTEGLTVEGKPFKDFVDAKNHAEAIDFLYEVVDTDRAISAGLIKEINALLLSGVSFTTAQNNQGQLIKKKATPGEYKSQPNHVLQADGTIHWYVDPVHVSDQIEELEKWFADNSDQLHSIILAALVHYNLVRIHPFDDGNGRGARILMNLILLKKGLFPAVIRNEKKRVYLDALKEADGGDIAPFVQFIASELTQTYEKVIADLESKPIS